MPMQDDPVTAEDLGFFDEEFVNAPEGDDYKPVPDGTYQAVINRAELMRTQGGQPLLKWQLKIVSGEYKGSVLFKASFIASGQNIEYLKKDLRRCGLDIERLSDLPDYLGTLLDRKIEVAKKTRPNPKDETRPYVNIYIQRLIEVDSGFAASDDDTPPPIDDDDIPF